VLCRSKKQITGFFGTKHAIDLSLQPHLTCITSVHPSQSVSQTVSHYRILGRIGGGGMGRGVRSRRPEARSPRRSEVSSRRTHQRCASVFRRYTGGPSGVIAKQGAKSPIKLGCCKQLFGPPGETARSSRIASGAMRFRGCARKEFEKTSMQLSLSPATVDSRLLVWDGNKHAEDRLVGQFSSYVF
jgi:hypothetical protein